jgi:hypothetical protein
MNQRPEHGSYLPLFGTPERFPRVRATAGYDRTEISKIFGILYQRVRNVMLRSGLMGCLKREMEAEREPAKWMLRLLPRGHIVDRPCRCILSRTL